jgi:sulfite reductase (NADPH) flavoprotein alpha-component
VPDATRGRDAQALASSLQPLPHREYSIASLPRDGSLQLLVRRMQRPDGTPGLGSAWLCDHVPPGGAVELRIRGNANFHLPPTGRPMILVGNGTGIAGLRAHLKARIAAGARRNWLLFGERNADRDAFYRDEIEAWRETGWIERMDLVFSRDGGACRYVQDALRRDPAALRHWIDDGAVVYVCGSLQGMAPGVDAVLREILGDARVDAMLTDGDYRRDVY